MDNPSLHSISNEEDVEKATIIQVYYEKKEPTKESGEAIVVPEPQPDHEIVEQSKDIKDTLQNERNLLHLSPDMTRIPSPRIQGNRVRTISGSECTGELSHPLSPIEEKEIVPADPIQEDEIERQSFSLPGVAHTNVLVSHLMMNGIQSPNASTLVSSLSPIEESSPKSPASGASDSMVASISKQVPKKKNAGADKKPANGKKDDSKKKNNVPKKKKNSIPETAAKKIACLSALVNRPVPSFVSLSPIGIEQSVTLDFQSGITSASVNTDDFFQKKNEVLGQHVTTKSKVGLKLTDTYDSARNQLPFPTVQQLYKSEKFWNQCTIKTNIWRLKELFREQLIQIWKWIDSWPAYKRTRLLLQLFAKSPEKLIHFSAECVKQKTKEADEAPPPIILLSDKLLLEIFDKLSSNDLLRASCVCKHWNFILSNDDIWIERCDDIGNLYGIPRLPQLLESATRHDQVLDWKRAFIEVEEYLRKNLVPGTDKAIFSSSSSEESEEECETVDRFPNYISYWKVRKAEQEEELRKAREAGQKSAKSANGEGEEESQTKLVEDIKEDLKEDDERSDKCFKIDMFAELHNWDEVGQLNTIGQKFAVAFHVHEAIADCARRWPIHSHVIPVEKVEVLKAHSGAINVIKVQGNRIFSAGTDRSIRVWDKSGQCFAKISRGVKGGINDISIGDVDGPNVMFTASWDMSVKSWNSVTFRHKETFTGHKGSVQKVAADNKFVVSCSHDGTIKVWDRKTLECERTLTYHAGAVQCMIYHDRHIISGGVDKKIHIANAFTGRLIQTYIGHKCPVTALKKQHDLLASGDLEGNIFFWSLVNGDERPIEMFKAHESQINAICMHGRTFFTASKDALVKEWDLVTMVTVRVFQGHTDSVTDVQWTEDFLITASRDNQMRRWWWVKKEESEGKDEDDDDDDDQFI